MKRLIFGLVMTTAVFAAVAIAQDPQPAVSVGRAAAPPLQVALVAEPSAVDAERPLLQQPVLLPIW